MLLESLEWALVAPGLVVVATEWGECFLHRPSVLSDGDPFLVPMSEAGAKSTTRSLLDGVVRAGIARPTDVPSDRAPLTPALLVYTLAASYRTTHSTPGMFRIAARRCAALGRRELADFLEHKARHEAGHDRLARRDLLALGLPADRLVEVLKPRTALNLTRHFEASVRAENPIGCLGYTYCLERLAALRGEAEVEAVRRISPPDVDATRFLRVHSSLGSDVAHVEELVDVVSCLPASDRILIAQTASQTSLLMAEHIHLNRATVNDEVSHALRELGVPPLDWLRPCATSERGQASVSSTARASSKSAVPKPSVNQS